MDRATIVAAARSWVGTPYHHGADIRGAGVDCAMLLVRVYVDTGLVPPFDPRPYPVDWHLHRSDERYLAWLGRFGAEIAGPPGPGDLAAWRYGRCYSHAGIVADWPTVIHAYAREGVVLADAGKAPLAGHPVKFFSLWRKERS